MFAAYEVELAKRGAKVAVFDRDADKGETMREACAVLSTLGFTLAATRGTAAWLRAHGLDCETVNKVYEGGRTIVDRLKDAIRRRGENISSFEVEQVLIRHPAVALAAVFPVSSDLAEDEVMASIILKEGASASEEEMVRFCEGKMSYFAIPRFVEFVTNLPRTENGKVQKFKLRERGRTDATWDREKAGVVLKR